MATKTHAVRIWDLPVRVTHWAFAVLVPAMWFTADNSLWYWHTRIGHVLLGLLIFRVIWGFVGSDTARFSGFVRGPARVIAYLRGDYDAKAHIGHNPLGALAVIAMLVAIGAQVGMGLFAGDPFDGATGPLNALVGVGTADWITDTHEWFVYAVFAVIGLHIAAIAVYAAIRKQNHVGPMVKGKGAVAEGVEGNSDVSLGKLIVAITVAIGTVFWVSFGAPPLG